MKRRIMKKLTIGLLCAGVLTTGCIASKINAKLTQSVNDTKQVQECHNLRYCVDRIEGEYLVVEVYDENTNSISMIDIKIEEGYRVNASNEWYPLGFNFEE